MKLISKKIAAFGAGIALGATILVGSASPALAAADTGTIGAGKLARPVTSPYITYAHVTQCNTRFGTSGAALTYRGRVTLSDQVAYGGIHVAGFDGDSLVTTRKTGTSTNWSWRCMKLS